MLTVRPKISELDFRVFARSLHPELFETYATRTIVREAYQLRVDITSVGHLLTWQRDGLTVCEVAASHHQPLPEHRLLYHQPVGSPSGHRLAFQKQTEYSFRFQLEPADPCLFAAIQSELLKSSPCEGLMFQFQSSGRMALGAISYVNIQSRMNRVHIRAFHTFPDAYVVLKSESVFLVNPADE